MDAVVYIDVLKATFLPYFKDIQNFNFYFHNPIFWVFFMTLFLFLEIGRSWSPEKAFFFCTSIAFTLLGIKWIEKPMADFFTVQGYPSGFDPFILKIAALVIISVTVIYFVFIDNS
jgi:hypothetical protein